jgi:dinuclear metal center YbgI/SA1388 family protein
MTCYTLIMDTNELDLYFRNILDMDTVSSIDPSMNGFQVDSGIRMVNKVAFAVDASMETFKRAVDLNADILFVHHGLFWGFPLAVTDSHYKRLSYLINHNLSLYAVHLPLDMNSIIGNNYGIAEQLKLKNLCPFGSYKGVKIGFSGSLEEEKTIEDILDILGIDRKETLGILPFGKKMNTTIAVVSGGATSEINQAMNQNIDLYITGDLSHAVYHNCLEWGINMISAGHYFTETFGPRLLSEKLKTDTSLETVFIDVPTGL